MRHTGPAETESDRLTCSTRADWSVVRTVIAFGLGALLLFSGTSATDKGTEAKFWAAKVLVLAETIVYAIFVWLLYLSFFAAGRGNGMPSA